MQRIAIYQVLPRLYGNQNSTNTPNGTIAENGCGKMSAFTLARLKRLRQFGYTHIWYTGLLEHATTTDYSQYGITPDNPNIVKGKAGSPYAIKDYYDIDPDLADNPAERLSEFRALLERTHSAGLKAIIDFVPNHVSRQYHSDAAPQGIPQLGAGDDMSKNFSPQNNFYYLGGETLTIGYTDKSQPYHEQPAKATGNDCFSPTPGICDWYETVKLNYGVDYQGGMAHHFSPMPSTWKQMTQILHFWASQGVDGFRCDMAEMVPSDFWHYAISTIKAEFPQIIFIAEVYNPYQYREYIHHGGFDYLYDKVGLYDTLRAILCGSQPALSLTSCWQSVDDIRSHMLSFLENHDEQRIASDYFIANPERALPAMVVALSWGTNPFMIYAGQELGERGMDEEGFSGRDGRTTIFDYWSPSTLRKLPYGVSRLSSEERKLYETYKCLVEMQNSSPALREGSFYDLTYANTEGNPSFDAHSHYAFLRSHKGRHVLIVCNFSGQRAQVAINIPKHAFEYSQIKEGTVRATEMLTHRHLDVHLSSTTPLQTTVPAYGAVCLTFFQKI